MPLGIAQFQDLDAQKRHGGTDVGLFSMDFQGVSVDFKMIWIDFHMVLMVFTMF